MILSPVVSNFKIYTFVLPSPGLKSAHTFYSSLQEQEKEEVYQSSCEAIKHDLNQNLQVFHQVNYNGDNELASAMSAVSIPSIQCRKDMIFR